MDFNNLKLGNKIIINDYNIKHIAFFECFIENKKILFQNILDYSKNTQLKIGNVYEFLFITEDFELKYNCKILNYIDEGRRRFYLAEPSQIFDGEFKNIQKRKNVRFYCNLPYNLKIYKNIERKKDFKIDCIIKDIGFGGVRFLSNFELELNDKIEIDFNNHKEFFVAKGNIIHYQNYPKSNYKNQYRVRFFEVDFSDKDFFKKYFNV